MMGRGRHWIPKWKCKCPDCGWTGVRGNLTKSCPRCGGRKVRKAKEPSDEDSRWIADAAKEKK